MPNIRLTIAYEGTRYSGWQIQKNARTIQGEIEKALEKILGEKIRLIGAGRTDSGVHARAQVANFKSKKTSPIPGFGKPGIGEVFCRAVNAKLPGDICIIRAEKALPEFHSRFDAKSKVYRYAILNSPVSDPFIRDYCHKVSHELKLPLMRKEAAVLAGNHDFRCFQRKSARSPIKDTRRTIKEITFRKEKNLIYMDIEANGFLYNMVRNIAGTLIEIGREYFPEGSMREILSSRNRAKAGPTAPAKGLTLIRVKY